MFAKCARTSNQIERSERTEPKKKCQVEKKGLGTENQNCLKMGEARFNRGTGGTAGSRGVSIQPRASAIDKAEESSTTLRAPGDREPPSLSQFNVCRGFDVARSRATARPSSQVKLAAPPSTSNCHHDRPTTLFPPDPPVFGALLPDPLSAPAALQQISNSTTHSLCPRRPDIPHSHRPRLEPACIQDPHVESPLLPHVASIERTRHRAAAQPKILATMASKV